jgi:DNA-binding transcriptional LysR family regulator
LDYLVLHPERYVLVGAKTLLSGHAIRGPEDVVPHTLLDLAPDLPLFRYFLDSVGGSVPWRFQRTEYLGTIGAVRLRMLQGRGIGVLPSYFVAKDLREAALGRIMPRVPLRVDPEPRC